MRGGRDYGVFWGSEASALVRALFGCSLPASTKTIYSSLKLISRARGRYYDSES